MSKLRSRVLGVLKWSFAVLVLVFLVKSGKLSFDDLRKLASSPATALSAFGLTAVIVLASFQRWRFFLKAQEIEVPYAQTLKLGMLGQFFSAFMPGTVGGDLIKAVYVIRRYPTRKLSVVSTQVFDRASGFASMILLGATSFLIGRARMAELPQATLLQSLGWTLVSVAVCILLGLTLFPKIPANWIRRFGSKLAEPLLIYQKRPSYLWAALGIAACMHIINVAVLYIFGYSLAGPLPWGTIDLPFFVLASIMGLVAQAIPVAPMGIGVGQAAFAAIFHLFGAPDDSFGATLVTGLQLVNFCFNLTGAFFFATYRHEVEEIRAWPEKA